MTNTATQRILRRVNPSPCRLLLLKTKYFGGEKEHDVIRRRCFDAKQATDDSSRLFIVFSEKGRTESFLSEVMKVEPPLLVLAKYDVASFLVNLEKAEFRFSDPYFEAANPEKVRESFESCLQLSWPDAKCRLFKVKDDFDVTK